MSAMTPGKRTESRAKSQLQSDSPPRLLPRPTALAPDDAVPATDDALPDVQPLDSNGRSPPADL